MTLCNPQTLSKRQVKDQMNDMYYDVWKKSPNVTRRFTDRIAGFNEEASRDMFYEFAEQRLGLPFDADTPYTAANMRRLKVEIKLWNRSLGGKFGNFAFIVPEGISKGDPISRKFYTQLGTIINHERTNINNLMTLNKKISGHMLDAFISHQEELSGLGRVLAKKKGNEAIKNLRKIRKKLELEEFDEKGHSPVFDQFVTAMKDFIESNEGVTIRQFNHLMELTNGDFVRAKKEKFIDSRETLADGTNNEFFNQEIQFNSHVYQAAEVSRALTHEMGQVYINGLRKFTTLIALKYANTTNIKEAISKSDKARYLIEKVDEHIATIDKDNVPKGHKDWANKGGYFPHMTFDTIIDIKVKMGEAVDAKLGNKDATFDSTVDAILKTVSLDKLPGPVKGRTGASIGRFWDQDPMFVLNEYGHQAIQFNKLIHTQLNYLDALKYLPRTTDGEFVKGVKRFIEEEYTVFTHGTAGRPQMMNNAVIALNALQTARTMGLNITGGVKNFLSAAHFYSHVGLGALKNARADYRNDKGKVGIIMRDVEREQGFKFSDANQELYTEGLITAKERDSGEFRFDPETGKLKRGNTDLRNWMIKSGNWVLDKGLAFHRITENNQRKWMFRTAFHKKYSYLVDNGYSSDKAARFAKDFALRAVNGWAYEYAAYAKAKIVRGEWRIASEFEDGNVYSKLAGIGGGFSEMGMHLMHYPMSLIETQWSQLKGVGKSLLAKQGFADSEEMQYFARYAGTSLIVSLASILTNTNLFNIFENETQERLTRVINDLTEYDNPDKGTFGLLSEFTGTNIGMAKHLMIVGGVIDLEHSTLNKILFGNVDFANPDDKLTEMYSAYQYSTAWGVIKNKTWPALKAGRGRDLITHYLKLYPSKWTKSAHQKLPWATQKKGRSSQNKSIYDKRAIDILDQMLVGQ